MASLHDEKVDLTNSDDKLAAEGLKSLGYQQELTRVRHSSGLGFMYAYQCPKRVVDKGIVPHFVQ